MGSTSSRAKSGLVVNAESAETAAMPSKNARTGRSQVPAGRAKTTAAEAKKTATVSGGIEKKKQQPPKAKQPPAQDKDKAARLAALFATLREKAPVRTFRRRPKAVDFPSGSNKEQPIPSTSEDPCLPGLSDTPVPREAQSDNCLASEQDERAVFSLRSTAERFEPASLPPTPTHTSVTSHNPSLLVGGPGDEDVALYDAPTDQPGGVFGFPGFHHYRDGPEVSEDESSASESIARESSVDEGSACESSDEEVSVAESSDEESSAGEICVDEYSADESANAEDSDEEDSDEEDSDEEVSDEKVTGEKASNEEASDVESSGDESGESTVSEDEHGCESEDEDEGEEDETKANDSSEDDAIEIADAPQIQAFIIEEAEVDQSALQQAEQSDIELPDWEPQETDIVAVVAQQEAVPAVCAGDVEMTSRFNPFGPPSGAPSSSTPFSGGPGSGFVQNQPSTTPFGQPTAASTQQPAMSTAFAASSSPFGRSPSPSPFGQPSNSQSASNPFGAASFSQLANGAHNPFGPSNGLTPPSTSDQPRQPSPGPIVNPFAPPPKPSQSAFRGTSPAASAPFGIFTNALSDGAQIGVTKPNPFESLKYNSTSTSSQQSDVPKHNPFDAFKSDKPERSPSPAGPASSVHSGVKKVVRFADDVQSYTDTMPPQRTGGTGRFEPQPSQGTKQLSSLAVDYAQKVNAQLRADGISAPKWPPDPGNPAQRPAMERLKESYKKYRARAYDSLRKAEIIDHPDHKRRLEDALTFKGICEDMCPDYEQVTRICEYDVKKEEKRPAPNGGDPWPEPSKMVKKFARSAAGIEEPLPMDVRSVDALRRSTDYLLGELLQTDDQLPSLHGYLWDRTRAVRKDFSFHSQKSSEEMRVMVYILETIARFHVVSLHLLSKKGVASDDFDQQQEVQQLGATLLSLNETYDDCRPRNLVCENEGEFRALFLLLNKGDTAVVEKSLEWASQPWYNSTHMENAKSLLAALQSFDQVTGPFNPRALGGHFAASAFTKFFDLVGSKTVSYTMACMCEIHFTWLRQRILQTLVKGFARRRDWPRDITPRILNRMLRFDTVEEAVEFVKLHEFEFETRTVDGRQEQFLLLKSKRQHVPSPRVSQSHSATIVEAKRNGQPLAEVFRKSIYGDKDIEFKHGGSDRDNVFADNIPDNVDSDDGDDMFVGQSTRKISEPANGSHRNQPQAQHVGVSFGAQSAAPFTPQPFPFGGTTNPFGAPSSVAKTTPFAPSTTVNATQPQNGTIHHGATAASMPQPSTPVANPFKQGNSQPSTTFGKPTLSSQQSATNNEPATPASQPARAPDSSAFSFLGAAQKQKQAPASGASVFSEPSKTSSSPFHGFNPGSSQSGTPTVSTPSTWNKDTSTVGAKTTTPQSSVFSSLTPEQSTPPSGSSFHTSTPPAHSSSGAQPSAASTSPATSIFSAAGGVDTDKSTSAAPSTVSALSQPPATTSKTAVPASQPAPPQTSSQHVQTHATSTPRQPTSLPPSSAPPPTSDPMEGFTKWIVQGDGGLLEEFTEFTVEEILRATYQRWQAEEAERKRREEDEASWAAARKHMAYRLGVKYFYRWRKTARQLAMARILREGKAEYKAAMEAQAKAKRERRQKEERAAEKKKRDEIREREERLKNFTAADELEKIIAESQRSRQSSAEDALLASGVFAGVRNEKAAARRVVQEAYLTRPASSQSSMSMSMPPPAETPAKKEGWKTRSIREKLHLPKRRDSFSSASVAGTGASSFSQSLPVGGASKTARPPKLTNFSASTSSRKRSAETSDDEPEAKKGKILKSGLSLHWELRRRGLVQMPDGQWLPERIASQMFEGKRFAGYGDCGLGPANNRLREDIAALQHVGEKSNNMKAIPSDTASKESKLTALARRFGFPPTKRYRRDSVASGSSYNRTTTSLLSSSPGGKRKRDAADDDNNDEDAAGSPSAKKAHVLDSSSDGSDGDDGDDLTPAKKVERALNKMRRQLRELNENMDVLEAEDKPWMREEMERMKGGGGGRGHGRLNGGVRDESGS